VLCHIPFLVKSLGCLGAFSARSLERRIGYTKRAVRSTRSAGINATNLLEQEQIFHFLRLAKIIDFDEPYKKKKKSKKQTFRYHPRHDPESTHSDTDITKQYPSNGLLSSMTFLSNNFMTIQQKQCPNRLR
jgi:hypothetical protein